VAQETGTTYSEAATAERSFYRVTAVEYSGGEFIYVPGGTFTMGDTHGVGFDWELPTHIVTLEPFHISRHELSQAEYEAILGYNPSSEYGVGDNYPVYYVSWYSAIKYCNLRSMAEGLTACYTVGGSTDPADWGEVPDIYHPAWDSAICNWEANGYRLPTEAEWEYAARGAANNPDYLYSGSNIIDAVAWYWDNWGAANFCSKPVGGLAPNAIGAYDMSGNVWEWCWDWYSDSYYSSSPGDCPTGPANGTGRVMRGGSWGHNDYYCRVAGRNYNSPFNSVATIGLRVCKTAQ